MSYLDCSFQSPCADKPCLHYIRPYEKGEAGFCDIPEKFRCTEAMKSLTPALSTSAAQTWAKCKMSYYYHYILGLRLKPQYQASGLKMGSIWDKFIQKEPVDLLSLADKYQLSDTERGRLDAVMRAYEDLEIVESNGVYQEKIKFTILNQVVVGFIDKGCGEGFEEHKFTTRPDFYLHPENIYHQVGTYFIGKPLSLWCDMKVVTYPQIRVNTKKDETYDQYNERCYQEVMSHPSKYFIGFNAKNRTYGKRFYRTEFDLDSLITFYKWYAIELKETIDRNSWYRNDYACSVPYECDYLNIKRSGVVSEEIYYYHNHESQK